MHADITLSFLLTGSTIVSLMYGLVILFALAFAALTVFHECQSLSPPQSFYEPPTYTHGGLHVSHDLLTIIRFVMSIENANPTWIVTQPLHEWSGIEMKAHEETLDPYIHAVSWSKRSLGGFLELSALPRNVHRVCVDHNMLMGTPELNTLPSSLEHLDISHNRLSGFIHIHTVPESLEHLNLVQNDLSGRIDTLCVRGIREFKYDDQFQIH